MIAAPPPQQLALLHDDELVKLAALWRSQALHGVRPAFGVAHALEVECRRRARERGEPLARPAPAAATQMPWWKILWARASAHPAMALPQH
jgi:hypothetical protein